jgi:hypothetical protein
MGKTIRLTENDLTRLVKRVIIESELEIQPGDLTPEVNVSTSELDQEGTLPPIAVKALNSPMGKVLTTQIDEFCSKGQPKESILSFLRGKLREFRQKKKGKENQVQEQGNPILQAVGALAGFIVLMLILIRIFRGNDGCTRYSKRLRRNFSGY